MTEKKQIILESALKLFSKNGFTATSTSKIAKVSNVSEGLIFRHFGNKEGLLQAIMQMGKEKSLSIFESIIEIEDAEERLKAILSIPFSIPENDYSFWKLLYALKWQAEVYDAEMTTHLKQLLVNTLIELKFENPTVEAELALMLFDGMATAILLKDFKESDKIQKLIYKKYNLSF